MITATTTEYSMSSLERNGLPLAKARNVSRRIDSKILIVGSSILIVMVVTEIAILHFTHTMPSIFSNPMMSKVATGTWSAASILALLTLGWGFIDMRSAKKDENRKLTTIQLQRHLEEEETQLGKYEKSVKKELLNEKKHTERLHEIRQKISDIRIENQLSVTSDNL